MFFFYFPSLLSWHSNLFTLKISVSNFPHILSKPCLHISLPAHHLGMLVLLSVNNQFEKKTKTKKLAFYYIMCFLHEMMHFCDS